MSICKCVCLKVIAAAAASTEVRALMHRLYCTCMMEVLSLFELMVFCALRLVKEKREANKLKQYIREEFSQTVFGPH